MPIFKRWPWPYTMRTLNCNPDRCRGRTGLYLQLHWLGCCYVHRDAAAATSTRLGWKDLLGLGMHPRQLQLPGSRNPWVPKGCGIQQLPTTPLVAQGEVLSKRAVVTRELRGDFTESLRNSHGEWERVFLKRNEELHVKLQESCRKIPEKQRVGRLPEDKG